MKKILSSSLIQGLLWQLAGLLVGATFVTLIRLLLHLSPLGQFFFTEPAWVFGAFLGVLSFLVGSGVLTDWFRWAKGEETPEHREDPEGWIKYFNVSMDHKVIGVQYTVTSLFLLVVGGIFALIFRAELVRHCRHDSAGHAAMRHD